MAGRGWRVAANQVVLVVRRIGRRPPDSRMTRARPVGEAGCRAGRRPEQTPPERQIIFGRSLSRAERRRYPWRSAMKLYHVTTFGCQMNEHDSERMKGMLESLGYGEAESQDEADVILFNTCS